MQILGSLIFNLYFVLSTALWSLVVAFAGFFLSYERRFELVRSWARSVTHCLEMCCGLSYDVEGAEHFDGPAAVILQKHSSAWETVAGIVYCPAHTWVLKRELMWVPILNLALIAMRVIPINRKGRRSAVAQVIEHGTNRLGDGINVMIYPEGTRVAPGQNGRFGRSGAKLAVSAGVPVIPVAHNAGEFWGRNQHIKSRGTIRVVIGPPIPTLGRDPDDVTREAAEWLDVTMARISDAHASIAVTP
ncbi:MAG: lysophospholipid acyltransferase family protein [Pseudomonadota bacterium]